MERLPFFLPTITFKRPYIKVAKNTDPGARQTGRNPGCVPD